MGNTREGMVYEVEPGHREIRLLGRTILHDTPDKIKVWKVPDNIFGFSGTVGSYKAKKPHGFKPRDLVRAEIDEKGNIRSMERIGRTGWLAHNLLLIWFLGLFVGVLIIAVVR